MLLFSRYPPTLPPASCPLAQLIPRAFNIMTVKSLRTGLEVLNVCRSGFASHIFFFFTTLFPRPNQLPIRLFPS